MKRLVDFTPRDELLEIASRVAPLGWHVVIYFEAVDLPALWDFFTSLPTTVVVDQMGRPDVSKDVGRSEFALFEKVMREHKSVWSKVSCPERLSMTGPTAINDEQKTPMLMWFRLANASSNPSRIAHCRAPTGRI